MLSLRPLPLPVARALAAGVPVPPFGGRRDWHRDYPSAGTVQGVQLILAAYEALGRPLDTEPRWWIFQIVEDALVVGDVGFHGPPDPVGLVEVGYEVVAARQGRGIATRACAQLLVRAWRQGAAVVQAEAVNPASAAVLARNEFVRDADGIHRRYRPAA